jgi:hypothetical protein
MFGGRPYTFAVPEPKHKLTLETSPEHKADPKTVTSGESGSKSAEESLALETK